MKVRAKETGQYKGRLYERGTEFEIEDKTYPVYEIDDRSNKVLKDGKPVVVEHRPHLEHWMEPIEKEKKWYQ